MKDLACSTLGTVVVSAHKNCDVHRNISKKNSSFDWNKRVREIKTTVSLNATCAKPSIIFSE